MDLSGRWEFSFDRTLNGQLVPTSVPHEVIFIMLDERNLVGRLVFPAEDTSRFHGAGCNGKTATRSDHRRAQELL